LSTGDSTPLFSEDGIGCKELAKWFANNKEQTVEELQKLEGLSGGNAFLKLNLDNKFHSRILFSSHGIIDGRDNLDIQRLVEEKRLEILGVEGNEYTGNKLGGGVLNEVALYKIKENWILKHPDELFPAIEVTIENASSINEEMPYSFATKVLKDSAEDFKDKGFIVIEQPGFGFVVVPQFGVASIDEMTGLIADIRDKNKFIQISKDKDRIFSHTESGKIIQRLEELKKVDNIYNLNYKWLNVKKPEIVDTWQDLVLSEEEKKYASFLGLKNPQTVVFKTRDSNLTNYYTREFFLNSGFFNNHAGEILLYVDHGNQGGKNERSREKADEEFRVVATKVIEAGGAVVKYGGDEIIVVGLSKEQYLNIAKKATLEIWGVPVDKEMAALSFKKGIYLAKENIAEYVIPTGDNQAYGASGKQDILDKLDDKIESEKKGPFSSMENVDLGSLRVALEKFLDFAKQPKNRDLSNTRNAKVMVSILQILETFPGIVNWNIDIVLENEPRTLDKLGKISYNIVSKGGTEDGIKLLEQSDNTTTIQKPESIEDNPLGKRDEGNGRLVEGALQRIRIKPTDENKGTIKNDGNGTRKSEKVAWPYGTQRFFPLCSSTNGKLFYGRSASLFISQLVEVSRADRDLVGVATAFRAWWEFIPPDVGSKQGIYPEGSAIGTSPSGDRVYKSLYYFDGGNPKKKIFISPNSKKRTNKSGGELTEEARNRWNSTDQSNSNQGDDDDVSMASEELARGAKTSDALPPPIQNVGGVENSKGREGSELANRVGEYEHGGVPDVPNTDEIAGRGEKAGTSNSIPLDRQYQNYSNLNRRNDFEQRYDKTSDNGIGATGSDGTGEPSGTDENKQIIPNLQNQEKQGIKYILSSHLFYDSFLKKHFGDEKGGKLWDDLLTLFADVELKNKDDIDVIEKIFVGKDTKWWDEFADVFEKYTKDPEDFEKIPEKFKAFIQPLKKFLDGKFKQLSDRVQYTGLKNPFPDSAILLRMRMLDNPDLIQEMKRENANIVEELKQEVEVLKKLSYFPRTVKEALGQARALFGKDDISFAKWLNTQSGLKFRKIFTREDVREIDRLAMQDAGMDILDYIWTANRKIIMADFFQDLEKRYGNEMVRPTEYAPRDWVQLPSVPGFSLEPHLAMALKEKLDSGFKNPFLRSYAKVITFGKLQSFYLPPIVWVIDILQGLHLASPVEKSFYDWMGGIFSGTAWKEVKTKSGLYRAAKKGGLYGLPEWKWDIRQEYQRWLANQESNIIKRIKKRYGSIKAFGNILTDAHNSESFVTFGFGDASIRTSMLMAQLKKHPDIEIGSPEFNDLCHELANEFGPYERVRDNFRKAMNLWLYTPTFKITMINKALERYMSGATAWGKSNGKYGNRQRATILREQLAIRLLLYATLAVAGYKMVSPYKAAKKYIFTDDQGREYIKEKIVVLPNPIFIPEKILTRGLSRESKMAQTPVLRRLEDLQQNRDWRNQQIIQQGLSPDEKNLQLYEYVLKTIFPVYEFIENSKERTVDLILLNLAGISTYTRADYRKYIKNQIQNARYRARDAQRYLIQKYGQGEKFKNKTFKAVAYARFEIKFYEKLLDDYDGIMSGQGVGNFIKSFSVAYRPIVKKILDDFRNWEKEGGALERKEN